MVSPASSRGPRRALRVAMLYLLVSLGWILVTDQFLLRVVDPEPAALTWIQTAKGIGFVLLSALLLYVLVRRELTRTGRSEERFRTLVEQSLVGVYLIQGDRFRYVNPKMAEIFGYSPGEMRDRIRVDDAVAPEDRERVREKLERRLEGDLDGLQYRFRGRRKDGSLVSVEVVGRRIPWEGGFAVLGILVDVTRQDLVNEQLFRAQRMEAMGRLTGAVAHDFNNFLTAILGPLDFVLADLPPGAPEAVELGQARRVAQRAAALTQQLLAYSRHRLAVPRPVDLEEALAGLEPMLQRLAGDRVRVRIESAGERTVARIDPSHLDQVLVNLVVNAGEAMADDEAGEIRIRTVRLPAGHPALRKRSGEHRRDWVCVEVADTGCGMTPETQLHIFDPFFTTKPEGSGLGLSTVHGVVTQAGGFVRVESTPGVGTRFRLILPEAGGVPQRVAAHATPLTVVGGTETVLVVEDEDDVRRVLVRALERVGYRILDAPDRVRGEELAAAADEVDVVLADLGLPDGSGVEVAESVRLRFPSARVIFISGYSDAESAERLQSVEGWSFLEKPFAVHDLLAAVRRSVDGEGVAGRAGAGGAR